MIHFDHIIVGSSPVCMLKAIKLRQKGKKVCIIDSSDRLGGAWKTLAPDESGIGNVEIGCHIFEKDKKVFRFFENELNLKLVKLDPQPKITYGKRWLKYSLKNFMFIFRDVKYYFTYKYGFSHFRMNMYLFFKEIGQLNLKYYSFENDSIALAEKLSELVHRNGVEFKLNTRIKELRINKNQNYVELISDTGENINSNTISISYSSEVNEIFIDDQNQLEIFTKSKSEFVHLHLVIKDSKIKSFTYLRIFKNRLIHRVSDMSRQIKLGEGEHLICIGIYPNNFSNKSQEEIFAATLNELKRMELISGDATILKKRWNSYSSNTIDYLDLKKLEKISNNKIQVIYTPDLVLGVRSVL